MILRSLPLASGLVSDFSVCVFVCVGEGEIPQGSDSGLSLPYQSDVV